MQAQISSVVTGAPLATPCEPPHNTANPVGIAYTSLSATNPSTADAGRADIRQVHPTDSQAADSRSYLHSQQVPGAESISLQPATPAERLAAIGMTGELENTDPYTTSTSAEISAHRTAASSAVAERTAAESSRHHDDCGDVAMPHLDANPELAVDVCVPCSIHTGANSISSADHTAQKLLDTSDSPDRFKEPSASAVAGTSENECGGADADSAETRQLSHSALVPAPDSPLGLRSAVASRGFPHSVNGADSHRTGSPAHLAGAKQENLSTVGRGSTSPAPSIVPAFGHPDNSLRDLMNVMNAAGTRAPTSTSADFRPTKVTFSDPPVAIPPTGDSAAEMDEEIEGVLVDPLSLQPPAISPAGTPPSSAAPLSAVDRALANASAEWQRRSVSRQGDELAEWRIPSASASGSGSGACIHSNVPSSEICSTLQTCCVNYCGIASIDCLSETGLIHADHV